MARVVIGTRGSPLALWQARHIASRLREADSSLEIEERIIQTEGDATQGSSIANLGTTGVFVRRIEQALIAGGIDLAVHSLKDLPSDQPTGLMITAIPKRHDARDAIVSVEGWSLDDLPPATVVGTGSPRRRSQLLHARPDLQLSPIRGNVDTRVRKMKEGRYGAVMLALAGLERLGIDDVEIRPVDPSRCLPAVGQGALAIETRMDDPGIRQLVDALNDGPTVACITAERAFLRRLGGGCQAPATAHAAMVEGRLRVEAAVGEADGGTMILDRESGETGQAAEIGRRLAERLLVAGGRRILEAARDDLARDDARS